MSAHAPTRTRWPTVAFEASKAALRRLHDPAFMGCYFVGHMLDLGAGPDGMSKQQHLWPLLKSVRDWDVEDGDAQELPGIAPNSFDCIHASHLLEHVRNPSLALLAWHSALRPNGHVVALVPEEDLYEQGEFPSTFNPDHKHTFTMGKPYTWSPSSINVLRWLAGLTTEYEVVKVERLEYTWNPHGGRWDRTAGIIGESAIEFILRKRP